MGWTEAVGEGGGADLGESSAHSYAAVYRWRSGCLETLYSQPESDYSQREPPNGLPLQLLVSSSYSSVALGKRGRYWSTEV